LKKFLEDGGRIVTIGSSASLAYHLPYMTPWWKW
jgi:hypothetical protein